MCSGSRVRIAGRRNCMVFPLYDDNPFRLPVRPVVTWLLIATNLGIFLVELGGGAESARGLFEAFGLTPAILMAGTLAGHFAPAVTLLSYMFLHVNAGHLLGNMVFLWVFGDDVEE